MPIQFDVDPTVAHLAAATSAFVRDVVIPAERACGGSVHDAPEDLRRTLQKGARDAGVFAPHVPLRWGGHGLDLRGQAVVFEAAAGDGTRALPFVRCLDAFFAGRRDAATLNRL